MNILLNIRRRINRVVPPPEPVGLTLAVSEQSVERTAAQIYTATGTGLASSRMSWTKRMLYRNGKTFRVYANYLATDPYGQVMIFVFDNQKGFDRPTILGNVLSGFDGHYLPSMEIAPDPSDATDRIYVVQENLHNSPLDFYKSGANNSYSKFTQLTDIGTDLAYANLLSKDNGNRFIWSRGIAFDWDIYVTEASNKMETWGTQLRVSEAPSPELDTLRHYPGVPFGFQKANGKWGLLITARNDTNEAYYRHYWVETDDTLRTYNNVQETWSRNITTDGILTDSLLNTNAKYFESSGSTVNGGFPNAGMSSEGLRCIAVRGSDGTLANARFIYFLGGVWVSKALSIPSIAAGPQGGMGEYMMVFNEGDIKTVFWITDGTYYKPYLFQTTDLGDTWTNIFDFGHSGISANLGLALPNNIMEIPENENFEIQLIEVGTATTTRTWRKIAAWGTIQSIPGDDPTPAASMNYNSLGLFHYRANDGDMVRTGNNVTTWTDLFGIHNATGINNPQWDGVSGINFTAASSHAFAIQTPSTLVNKTTLTFFAVIKVTLGNLFLIYNHTQSTGSGKIWGFRVETTGLFSLQFTDTTSYFVTSQDTVADGTPHVVAATVDNRGAVHLWVDGRKQFFSTGLAAGSALWAQMGKGPAAITGINVANIARTDNSVTDTYSTGTIYQQALFSDVLPQDEIDARNKKLCNDYGITYLSSYEIPL